MSGPPLTRPRAHRSLAVALAILSGALGAQSESDASVPPQGDRAAQFQELLTRHCARCHGPSEQKGEIRFDQLDELAEGERASLLGRIRDALAFEEMPPDDEPQPSVDERRLLIEWVEGQFDRAAGARDRLRYPQYGNLVDHDALFEPPAGAAPFTPARRWRVNPQIFHQRVMDVFKLEGRARQQMQHRAFVGVVNPFVQTDASGVRDYDLGTLDGGHLLVMLGNAAWIAERQIAIARALRGEKVVFADPKDRWMPRPLPESYAAFAAILESTQPPGLDATESAIREQFDCALRRDPTATELARYAQLMRAAAERGGNRAGLRQMLTGVLLESEFVYRIELGAGPEDDHGRRMLAPREAADAIAYALGDRRPDAALRAAAAEGRLATRADFEREVRRLLDDADHYRGQIDPSLNGKHFRSNETSHPKVVRFFREFFGYPAATKVFKDPPRSGGIYRNPHRGTAATPGRLILETDRMVTRIVDADRHVFERLLTSDEFFVYHDKDNEAGAEIIRQWREVYERLEETRWRTEPEAVLAEHLEFLKGIPVLRIKDDSRPGELVNYMHFFEEHFGRGITPFTTVPWAHGYTFHHAPLYNLPPTPSIGRYGSWKSTEYRGEKVDDRTFWDYPTEQPFRIENRKGILTHPSWLIAHSTNFFPDAVRRGRWIREKLLAGRVPDVPITVDAQVPEDPHRTFRQRLEEVTSVNECWRCHQHMNPLGLPFEAFDDFGRFRTHEVLEHPENLISRGNGKTTFDVYPTAPVETTGRLEGTGDPALDGDVADPFDLIDRLARSDRVRQSILRHAFRFYMGRNETLADAQTLADAERAYLDNDGSFRAVIVSLLTSDSFLYRKTVEENP